MKIREPYLVNFRDLPFTDDHYDGFAGGGGASTGYEMATGRPVTAALNHSLAALRMHKVNHRRTRHYCEDIRTVKPRRVCRGRRPGSAHFSPDCRDFSKAKGGKPKSKRVRGLAWVIIHWINEVAPGLITWENVEEFEGWCPLLRDGTRSEWRPGWFFQCLTGAMLRRGYVVQFRGADGIVYQRTWAGFEPVFEGGRILHWSGRASEFGAPTIRQRHFGMARCDGLPIAWPKPTHAPVARAGLLPELSAAGCIDFSLPCPSIFLTREDARSQGLKIKRPLVDASCERVAKGVKRFVMDAADPFIVNLTHQGMDGVESLAKPFKTITGAHRGEKALVAPVLAYGQNGGGSRSIRKPVHTITASKKDTNQVISAHVVKMRGRRAHSPGHDLRDPLATISAGGTHLAVVSTFFAQNNGGRIGHPARKPLSTIMGRGTNQSVVATLLCKYFGTEQDPRLNEPMHTVTTKDRFASVNVQCEIPPLTPELIAKAHRVAAFLRQYGVEFKGEFAMCGEYVIVDIGLRMLTPRELFRAQGFPESYIIGDDPKQGLKLTKTQQVHMCGNSVSPPIMAAIYRANLPAERLQEAA